MYWQAIGEWSICLSMFNCLLNLFALLCADLSYNKALPGLLVKDKTKKILELLEDERNFKQVLSMLNLRSNHLWRFVDIIWQGTMILPLKLVLYTLLVRYGNHLLFGELTLHSLTPEELYLVDERMLDAFKILGMKDLREKRAGSAKRKT